jgi:RNA polymerase sigma factor (sigma-70 family)
MASVHSTHPASGDVRFSADFIANIPRYQLAIRRQPVMGWASERNLDGDLAQLALLDLARVDSRFDATRATSPHHFRLAVLGSRVSDCARKLMRMHHEVADVHIPLDADDEEGDEGFGARFQRSEEAGENPVLDGAIRGQVASAVHAAVKTLSARQREVIELLLEDLTDKEIAAHLCITVQAVNKTKLAAIAKLKQVVLAQFRSN